MTEAENQFRKLRGGDAPVVVDGYQYPLLVLPIAMQKGGIVGWQRAGYAAQPVPPGYTFHVRVAISNENLPGLFVAGIIYFMESGRPLVSFDDQFAIGPARPSGQLYTAFDRRMSWLSNDGVIGFGAIAESPRFAIYVDKYKHVHILASEPKAVATLTDILERERGLSRIDGLGFLSDVPCARATSGDIALADDLAEELQLEPCDAPAFAV